MIRLVILDQGGLVTVGGFDIMPEAAARFGIDADRLRGLLAPDLPAFMRGHMAETELWGRLAARSGHRASGPLFEELFRPALDAEALALVERLGRAGHRVVAGTNTIDSHFRMLAAAGHFSAYSAVYASHLLGLAKPEPGFFEHILREEGVRAEEAFFADDSEENIVAARALGLDALLYRGPGELEKALAARGVRAAAPLGLRGAPAAARQP